MSAFEKIERQREAEKLLCKKESLDYSNLLIPLMLNSNSEYTFEFCVGNKLEQAILSVTAFDGHFNNSSVTLYAFDKKDRKREKIKLIKDIFSGKIELKDFSDMKFIREE